MNIFILARDPRRAAQHLCDQHVVKMLVETAQLLCAAFPPGCAPYRRTHFNHPCALWTRESRANFDWLVEHGRGIAAEYTYRYGRVHRSEAVVEFCREASLALPFAFTRPTRHVLAMPERFHHHDPVTAYRAYYRGAKRRFARYRYRPAPSWL